MWLWPPRKKDVSNFSNGLYKYNQADKKIAKGVTGHVFMGH